MKEIKNKFNIKSDEFKEVFETLLKDYLEVKKTATELGYDQASFKFKDYLDNYIQLNNFTK